jgi:hypothetical protein
VSLKDRIKLEQEMTDFLLRHSDIPKDIRDEIERWRFNLAEDNISEAKARKEAEALMQAARMVVKGPSEGVH